MQYPIFCYGSHNICWIAEDMIYENNKANYSKFLKAGRSKSAKDEDVNHKFDTALDELENDPCVDLDIKTTESVGVVIEKWCFNCIFFWKNWDF